MAINASLNATNETLNATNAAGGLLNATSNATNAALDKAAALVPVAQSFIPLVFSRLWSLIAAPFRHGEMLWIILPLFFTLVVMEFYYDRHNDEDLGWGAALANSLVLIFIAIDLVKTAFNHATPWTVAQEVWRYVFSDGVINLPFTVLLLIGFLAVLGIALTVITYFHLLPEKMAYVVTSHPPINFLAYFAISIVYTAGKPYEIPFDLATCVAGGILFILLLLLVFISKRLLRRVIGNTTMWN